MGKVNKLSYLLAVFAAVVCVLFSMAGGGAVTARAAVSSAVEFEKTKALDDLKRSSIDGKLFTLDDYGFDDGKETQVLSFVEYCYSYYANKQDNYGLYLYVYNPQGINFDYDSDKNKIQMTTGDADNASYTKYSLQLLNYSTDAGHIGLFIKYKVVLPTSEKQRILDELNPEKRIYRVSGIELLTEGARLAEDYFVATTYTYSGYADGYGSKAESGNLSCTKQELDTIQLDVQGTYYRYPTTLSTATQVNSVYFAVDNKYLNKFGKLYEIWAEYWQYELAPVVVVDDDTLYNSINNAVPDLKAADVNSDFRIFAYTRSGYAPVSGSYYYCDWGYGRGWSLDFFGSDIYQNSGYQDYFKKPLIFKADNPSTATINRTELEKKMYELSSETGAADGTLNDYVLTGGKGYQLIDLTADDLFDLKGFDVGNGFLNWWYGLWGHNNQTIPDISPIQEITAADLKRKDISNDLLIAGEDVTAFKDYCNESMSQDKTVFLFRYGTSEFKELSAIAIPQGVTWTFSERDFQSVRWQTIDKDFDIIQLGFGNAEHLVIIPVVSNPIDNIASSQSMQEIFESVGKSGLKWWQILLGLIAFIVLFPIIIKLLFLLIKVLFKVLSFPFRRMKRRKQQKQEKAYEAAWDEYFDVEHYDLDDLEFYDGEDWW